MHHYTEAQIDEMMEALMFYADYAGNTDYGLYVHYDEELRGNFVDEGFVAKAALANATGGMYG